MQVFIKVFNDKTYILNMDNINNIDDFKVAVEKKCRMPVRFQKFIYQGRYLKDISKFSHGDTIFCDTINFGL